jgi:hypothetical protein
MKKCRNGKPKKDRPDILAELVAQVPGRHAICTSAMNDSMSWAVGASRREAAQQEGPGCHPARHLSVVRRRHGYAWLPMPVNNQMKRERKP